MAFENDSSGWGRKSKGDIAGLAFFLFATVVSFMAALERPTILAWLATVHNGLLAIVFLVRRKPLRSDRIGLWLGLIAALLPTTTLPDRISTPLLGIGLLSYAFLLWALVVLWKSFGIAPADRGLVTKAPYSLVRHPMYLGELVFRLVLVSANFTLWSAIAFLALTAVQILRIIREEPVISGYNEYKATVRWRLIPGVW